MWALCGAGERPAASPTASGEAGVLQAGENLARGDGQPGGESASLDPSSSVLSVMMSPFPSKGRCVIPAPFSSESRGEDEKPVPVTCYGMLHVQ